MISPRVSAAPSWRLRFARQRVEGYLSRLRRLLQRLAGRPGEETYGLSEPLDEAQIEDLYRETVGRQAFYDQGYAAQLSAHQEQRDAARDVAHLLVELLGPGSALDVGCGTGQLVARMRSLGVEASGCDFSEAILGRALAAVRPHLRRLEVSELGAYPAQSVDLVSCMEVLEHLPVSRIEAAVEELRRIARGAIFITTPSFGPDRTGHYGLPMNESWLADARANRRFSRIVVDPHGRPHHGHLTLASHRWWTELFLRHGLARNHDLERRLLEDPRRSLGRWRLNPYVLHEVRSPGFVAGESCARQGVSGWYGLERDEQGRAFRWSSARSTSVHRASGGEGRLRMTLAGGPPALVDDRSVEVVIRPALGAGEAVRGSITVPLGRWEELVLDDLEVPDGLIEVTLEVAGTFRPARLPGGGDDHRELGVQVSDVVLE